MSFTKHFSLICFLFALVPVKGQTAFVEIYGNVKDRNENRNLEEINVALKGNNGNVFKTKTDTLGNYSLPVPKSVISRMINLTFNQDYNAYRKKYSKDTTCAILPFNREYEQLFFDKETSKIDSVDRIKVDVIMLHPGGCRTFPIVYFIKDSLTLLNRDQDYYEDSEETMHFMRCFMAVNNGLVIEIGGHVGFDEKNKIKLSEERANYIRDRFIKEGINPERLKAKGYGNEKPKISKAQIAKAKTKEEKEQLDLFNGRCSFFILSDNYGK